jgi:TetR/AcrR family transcriptional regulator
MGENKTQDRSRNTMENILKAATEQFARKGYEGARVDEIARQANINKASLYYHFVDKAGLYEQVLIQALRGLNHRIVENTKEAATHRERLKHFILTLGNNLESSPHMAVILSRAISDTDGKLPDPVIQQIMQIFGVLFCIIEEGQADGHFRQANPLVVYDLIVGGLIHHRAGEEIQTRIGALGESVFERKFSTPFDEAVGHIAELIVNSLSNKRG